MNQARFTAAGLSLLGLAISAWMARPTDAANFEGWAVSIFLFSVAWLIPLGLAAGRSFQSAAFGALIAVTASELLFFFAISDAMAYVIKPAIQIPAAAIGAWLGTIAGNRSRQAPNGV